MKILKFMCHRGVDNMLKEALGDKLHLYYAADDGMKWCDTTFKHKINEGGPTGYWDCVIMDDIRTTNAVIAAIKNGDIKVGQFIVYVHGTYSKWVGFQQWANKNWKNCHFIFTDVCRKAAICEWYKEEPLTNLILPIHLPDSYYETPIATVRKDRVCLVGNRLLDTAKIYNSRLTTHILMLMFGKLEDKMDIYGWNDHAVNREIGGMKLPDNLFHGPVVLSTLGGYKVAANVSAVNTMGFVLLEQIAAGIPSVMTPKIDFINKDCPFTMTDDPAVFVEAVSHQLLEHDLMAVERGQQGRDFLRKWFPFENYKKKITEWLEEM